MTLLLLVLSSSISTILAQSLTSVIASNVELSSLNGQVKKLPHFTAYLDGLAQITFLAPSNDAFATFFSSAMGKAASQDATLLGAILTYHIQNGTWYEPVNSPGSASPHFIRTALSSPQYTNVTKGQFVEGIHDVTGAALLYSGFADTSKIITPNINITNGLLHVIDTVLTIPQDISTTAVAAGLTASVGAFAVADSLDVLDYSKDVTAFIPNNQAFASVASALENMNSSDLANVMKYHVVQGNWPDFYIGTRGWTFGQNTTLATLSGENITIKTGSDGTTYVNSAQVVIPNLLVANGVIHVIDNVLNPGDVSATPDFSSSTQAPAFSGATTVSGSAVPFTNDVTLPTALETPGNTAGGRGLGTGAKTGIGIGVAFGVFSIIGFIIFFMYQRRRSHTGKSSQLGEKSLPTELDSENSRTEIDSKTVQEADSSTLPGHELDLTPMKPELDSRSNWPIEIDGRGVWPKEKDASFFGRWAQPSF